MSSWSSTEASGYRGWTPRAPDLTIEQVTIEDAVDDLAAVLDVPNREPSGLAAYSRRARGYGPGRLHSTAAFPTVRAIAPEQPVARVQECDPPFPP